MEVMAVLEAAGQIMVLVAQETHHQLVHHKAVTVELRLILPRIMEPVAVVVPVQLATEAGLQRVVVAQEQHHLFLAVP